MTKVNFNTVKATADTVYKLKSDMTYSIMTGKYKDYKTASKSLAQIAVQNFELVQNTPGMQITGQIPIFSKTFLKMTKVYILNKLRIKTPEEKEFAAMAKEENIRESFRKSVKEQVKKSIRFDIDQTIQPKIDAMAEEETNRLMAYIPKDIMKMLEDNVVAHGGKIEDATRNAAFKHVGRFWINDSKTKLNTHFFSKALLKSLNIPIKP